MKTSGGSEVRLLEERPDVGSGMMKAMEERIQLKINQGIETVKNTSIKRLDRV